MFLYPLVGGMSIERPQKEPRGLRTGSVALWAKHRPQCCYLVPSWFIASVATTASAGGSFNARRPVRRPVARHNAGHNERAKLVRDAPPFYAARGRSSLRAPGRWASSEMLPWALISGRRRPWTLPGGEQTRGGQQHAAMDPWNAAERATGRGLPALVHN